MALYLTPKPMFKFWDDYEKKKKNVLLQNFTYELLYPYGSD